jgi:tetratricopeptide (TPR) repeat protein
MIGSLASANARTLLRILALALGLAGTCAQAQTQGSQPGSVPGPVMEMIAAWQNSARAPTPEAKLAEIEKALKIARSFDQWPLRSPERDELLGQMWGQLGNEYRRIRSNARSEALEKAIAAYTQALNHFSMQRYPDGWARVQYGLGAAYLDRARGDRADNIEQAIAHLNRCMTVLTREKAPAMWADAQTILSTAFWHRARGSRADNLEQALEAARSALTILGRDKQPSDWAGAQAALGAAYWARIRGDRADNVEAAIAAYEQALDVVRRDKDPRTWAGLQDNLGMALAVRQRGDSTANLKAALAAFTHAEQVFTRNAYPSEWAQLQMNIANTALEFEVGGASRRGNVETALKAYGYALTVYNRQTTPERWARIMLNVGSAYLDRREGARAENIEKAVEALTQSLTVYTPALDPNKWAIAQANLGSAYRQRLRGDRDRNLQLASEGFEAALTVHALSAAPMQHMLTAHAAGEVAALRRDWRGAKAHLGSAIAASTILFGEGLNRSEAERVVRSGGRLYASAAYVAAELGNASLALDTLEAGRARLLRTALGLDALALPEADRKRLAELRAAVPDLEARLLTATGDERSTILNALAERRKAIELTIKARLNTKDGDPLHATGTALASSLLQSHSAIIAPIVTELGAKLLIVTRSDREPKINVVPLTRLTEDGLLKFLRGEAERDELGGWLAAYVGLVQQSADVAAERRFLNAVRDLGPKLGDMLGAELSAALDKAGVRPDASIVGCPTAPSGCCLSACRARIPARHPCSTATRWS